MNIFNKRPEFSWLAVLMLILVSISGYGQSQTLVSHNFNSQCSLPGGWTSYNVDGSCAWRCDYGGFTQNNHSSQGCSGAANDWLILPLVDFSIYQNEKLQISVTKQYNGPNLVIRYSSNYPGSGNPTNYTWSQLASFGGSANTTVNIGSLTQAGYIAIHYTSNSNATNQAARWTVNNVTVTGEPLLLIDSLKVNTIYSTQAGVEAEVITDGGQTVTDRGFLWSTSPGIQLNGANVTKVSVSGGVGQFSATMSALPSGTLIYVRGFASNAFMDRYTNEQSFYTLSAEPLSYPASFTATTQSKNSIELNWSQLNDADGYLILKKAYSATNGMPGDATFYNTNDPLGDGEVAAIISSGSTTSVTINNLIQGTRYYFTLFPFGYDGSHAATANYRTTPVVPVANDSTWGNPPSPLTTVVGVVASEVPVISSLENELLIDSSNGVQVWSLQLRDGGSAMNDADDLPSILTKLVLVTGSLNTVSNWQQKLQAAVLIDDSTGAIFSNGLIHPNAIEFDGYDLEAADDNFHSFRIKISLAETAQDDNSILQFQISQDNITLKDPLYGSQAATFTTYSDSTQNRIEVVATKLEFNNHPATQVEAGAPLIDPIEVAARDTFGGLDLDYTSNITLDATASNLIAAPRTVAAQNGVALFDTVRFNLAVEFDTLMASSGTLFPVKGNRFKVVVSNESDIVADGTFNYPENISHLNYPDNGSMPQSNSLEVFRFWLRDGGEDGDNDFEVTELNTLKVNISNAYLISRIGLYAGTTLLEETDNIQGSGQNQYVLFNNLDTMAMDDDSIRLHLSVTFNAMANDGDQFSFSITNATANDTFSKFGSVNAGGAESSITGNRNRINIVASRLEFVQQPVDIYRGAVMKPQVLVVAKDAAGNLDYSGRPVTVTVSGSGFSYGTVSTVAIASVRQGAAFKQLIFNTAATDAYLVAHSGNLDSAVSDSFDILIPVWFRSVQTGLWSDLATWETSTDFGANWVPAGVVPEYKIHGLITISAGDTVYMDGQNVEENTVDELVVEAGAFLYTPQGNGSFLTVNNAGGDDVEIYGRLVHNNAAAASAIDFAPNARMVVKKAGAIELKSTGNALDWAGNTQIHFEDSAFYMHSTAQPNTIGAGVYFPTAGTQEVAIFLVNNQVQYPGNLQNQSANLEINGLVRVAANRSFTVGGNGNRIVRNGLDGSGNIMIQGAAQLKITGEAILAGSGQISVSGQSSGLFIEPTSECRLLNDKSILDNGSMGFVIRGTFDAGVSQISGNSPVTLADGSTLITAHANGVDGSFQSTGTESFQPLAAYRFNGTVAQNSGIITGAKARMLHIDNPDGVQLDQEITVSDSLILGTGNIGTSIQNWLAVEGVISGYSATSFVDGPLRALVAPMSSFEFPVGKSLSYGPVTYYSEANANSWIQLEYFDRNPQQASLDTSAKGLGLASIRADEYWHIDSLTATAGRLEISYTAHSNLAGVDRENIRLISFDGSMWNSEGPANRDATLNEVVSDRLNRFGFFTIGIDSACTIPNAPVVAPSRVCAGGDAFLTANSPVGLRWFTVAVAGTPIAEGNNIFLSGVTTDSVFYVEAKDIGCVSARVAYPIQLQQLPAAPVVSGKMTLCYEEQAELNVPAGGEVNWYTSASSVSAVQIGTNFQSAPLPADTAFFVESVLNGCAGPRTPVNLSVRAKLIEPNTQSVNVCEGDDAVVKATSNFSLRWFSNLSDTQAFATAPSISLTQVTKDTSFYVEAFDGQCLSPRVTILVKNNIRPTKPALFTAQGCKGSPVTLQGNGTDIHWFTDSSATIAAATGDTYTTPALGSSRWYYAASFNGTCLSEKEAVLAEIFELPQSANITAVQFTPANALVSIETGAVADNYEWDFGTDATPQTAIGPGPHNVLWTSKGEKNIVLRVWNGNQVVQCALTDTAMIQVQPGLAVNGAGTNEVKVYPNPLSNSLQVKLNTPDTYLVKLVGVTGQVLYENAAYRDEERIDTQTLKPGVYFVVIENGGTRYSVKVVK